MRTTVVRLSIAFALSVAFFGLWIQTSGAHGSYSLGTIAGRWTYTEEWETAGQYHTSIGIFSFDGSGACKLTYLVNDPASTGQQSWQKATCTYELARNGRGKIRGDVTPSEFIVTGHGKVITYIFNQSGVVGRGEMRRM